MVHQSTISRLAAADRKNELMAERAYALQAIYCASFLVVGALVGRFFHYAKTSYRERMTQGVRYTLIWVCVTLFFVVSLFALAAMSRTGLLTESAKRLSIALGLIGAMGGFLYGHIRK